MLGCFILDLLTLSANLGLCEIVLSLEDQEKAIKAFTILCASHKAAHSNHSIRFRAIGLAPIRFFIKRRESPFIFQHFVLWKLEPFSDRWTKCPVKEASKCDGGYDSDNDVDHWPCASLRPPSYRIRTYRASRFRPSSLSRLFHAGIELPGIPCSITVHARSGEG
jgi:hypothetical protein